MQLEFLLAYASHFHLTASELGELLDVTARTASEVRLAWIRSLRAAAKQLPWCRSIPTPRNAATRLRPPGMTLPQSLAQCHLLRHRLARRRRDTVGACRDLSATRAAALVGAGGEGAKERLAVGADADGLDHVTWTREFPEGFSKALAWLVGVRGPFKGWGAGVGEEPCLGARESLVLVRDGREYG